MKITQFTDYSLRLLIYLAPRRDRVVPMREVAEYYGISAEHLKKIVHCLNALGHVSTVRGKKGGLVIARDPAAINIGQLIRAEENMTLLPCLDAGDTCPLNQCKLASVVDQARAAFLSVLDRHTLADLI